jgi:putative nucleotidyltransferase with HDIG domain
LPGTPAHLFKRFFDVASARPLNDSERHDVIQWLTPETAKVFFAQGIADQRHGHHAASMVTAGGVDDSAVIMTALLHDVGKRHARLGIIGRSVASMLILLGLPLSGRMQAYRDHGMVAARELADLSVPSLVVDFALHHHGRRPATIDPGVWDVLVAADQPAKPWLGLAGRITSKHT